LQKIYDNKHATFIEFIQHIIGLTELHSFSETVNESFDAFIRTHTTFSKQQIQFLLMLKDYIIDTGSVSKRDLVDAPFTQLHPHGVMGMFSQNEMEEIFNFATTLL
ncbi:MAG: restriction endonuclease subunit R, partial [Candidatus Omnitrophica bacterium]|nr:restriction endonuclease subunit R [Candidatus Omnitrophota bacterium]